MYVSIIDLHHIISCLVWVVVAMPSECLYHLVVYDLNLHGVINYSCIAWLSGFYAVCKLKLRIQSL